MSSIRLSLSNVYNIIALRLYISLKDIYKFIIKLMGRNLYFLLTAHKLKRVEIETNASCNRRCKYCPVSTEKERKGQMSDDLFYKIIKDLKLIKYSGYISFHFYNEPLCDERLEQFIEYTHNKIPKAKIVIFTNGDKLTKDRICSILSAGADNIRISHHDSNSVSKIDTLLEGIDPKLALRITRVKYYANEVPLSNRGGIIHLESSQKKNNRTGGCDAVNVLVVDYKGETALCCNDFFVVNGYGNIKDISVKEIWKQSKRSRNNIFSGHYHLEICQNCDP